MGIIRSINLEGRPYIPINAIHMHSGLKADLYPVREGDELRQSAFQRREEVDYGPPIGKVYIHSPEDLILCKLMYKVVGVREILNSSPGGHGGHITAHREMFGSLSLITSEGRV